MIPWLLLLAPFFSAPSPDGWEQRAKPEYVGTDPRVYRGRLVVFTPTSDQFGLDERWESLDSARSWTRSTTSTTGAQIWQPVRIGNEEILFELRSNGTAGLHDLVRTDANGARVVLNDLKFPGMTGLPVVEVVGRFAFTRTNSGLQKSSDGGRTWRVVGPCISTADRSPVACSLNWGDLYYDSPRMVSLRERLVVYHRQRLWTSEDSGDSWKALPMGLNVSEAHRGSAASSSSSLFLSKAKGPLEIKVNSDSWDTVSQLSGWPRDSTGKFMTVQGLLRFKDTLWGLARRSLHFWDPVLSHWRPASLSAPESSTFLSLDTLYGNLCLRTNERLLFRTSTGIVRQAEWPSVPVQGGRTSLAWHAGKLFACSWSECAVSTDSGLTWTDASLGVEGTFVTNLASTSRGLIASTESFGILLWNGKAWTNSGLGGQPVFEDGKLYWVGELAHHGESLLFTQTWGTERWFQEKAGSPWVRADSGLVGVAYGNGYWWGRSDSGNLVRSQDALQWTAFDSPLRGTPRQVGQRMVLTAGNPSATRDSGLAWLEEDGWKVDRSVGPTGNGSIVAEWAGGLAVLTDQGIRLTGPGVTPQTFPIPYQRFAPWWGAVLAVGDRLFVASATGLWSRTSPASLRVDRRWDPGHGIHLVDRSLLVPAQKEAPIHVDWFEPSGARLGRTIMGVEDQRTRLDLALPRSGLVFVRVRSGSMEKSFSMVLTAP